MTLTNDSSPAMGKPLSPDPFVLSDPAPCLDAAMEDGGERLAAVFLNAVRFCAGRLRAHKAGIAEPIEGGDWLCVSVVPANEESTEGTKSITKAIPMAASIVGYALTTANAAISPDLNDDKRFDDRFLRELGVRSALVLPVLLDDRPVCTLGIFRSDPHDFALDEVCYAERLATGMANLLKKAGWEYWPDDRRSILPSSERIRATHESRSRLLADEGSQQPVATLSEREAWADCRESPRREYRYTQRIAPIYGDSMPDWDEFIEVQCGDLSGGGISLWLPARPNFRELIVALGRPPSLVHFAAHVVYVRDSEWAGRRMYQVGCHFLRRVYL